MACANFRAGAVCCSYVSCCDYEVPKERKCSGAGRTFSFLLAVREHDLPGVLVVELSSRE